MPFLPMPFLPMLPLPEVEIDSDCRYIASTTPPGEESDLNGRCVATSTPLDEERRTPPDEDASREESSTPSDEDPMDSDLYEAGIILPRGIILPDEEEDCEPSENLEYYFPSGAKRPRPLENGGVEFAVRSSPLFVVQEFLRAQENGEIGFPDESNLDVNVWKHLPDDLHSRILERLPYSSLIKFRSVSKKWNSLIGSETFHPSAPNVARKSLPMYFHDDEPPTVFNRRNNCWQQLSFLFLGTPTSMLSLLVSAGGLLVFKTGIAGELIVCNPVTKQSRRLQVPCRVRHDSVSLLPAHSKLITVYENPHSTRTMKVFNISCFDKEVVVGMVMGLDGRSYRLVVAGVKISDVSNARTTLVYDSETDSWRRGGEVPRGVRFWRSGKPVASDGFLYCITYNEHGWIHGWGELCNAVRPWSVVRYDLEHDTWNEVRLPRRTTILHQLVEHEGRILVVQRRARDQTQMFTTEIREDGVAKPFMITKMPVELFPDAVKRDVVLGDWCVGQGDRMYIAGVYPENSWQYSIESSCYRPPNVDRSLGIGVLAHNANDDTWTQLPDLCGRYYPEGLYAFEPTLAKV